MSTIEPALILPLHIEIAILLVAMLVMAPAGYALFRLVERRGRTLGTVAPAASMAMRGLNPSRRQAATLAAALSGAAVEAQARTRSKQHSNGARYYATDARGELRRTGRETTMNDQTAASLQLLTDRMEIQRVVDEIDNAVDAKDWATCRGYFTDEIYADFTSLAGGSPGRIPADALVGGWSTALFSAKQSHHMRSNHRITVDGDRAEVFSRGYALNILASKNGSDLWEVWGDYVHTLERTPQGWKCSGMTFTVTHARGNERVRDFVPPR